MISSIAKENIVFVDETGIDKYLYRPYGRAPKGQRVLGKVSGKKFKRVSIVAGLCGKRIVSPLQYSNSMDSRLFKFWVEKQLLPQLKEGSVIVMDNASFHCKKTLPKIAQKAGCRIVFLPPYSPDLNPIEKFWAWLKSRLRIVLPNFTSLNDALTDCFQVA